MNFFGASDPASTTSPPGRRGVLSLPCVILAAGLLVVAFIEPGARAIAAFAVGLALLAAALLRGGRTARHAKGREADSASSLWPNATLKSVVNAMREPAFVFDRDLALRFSNANGIRTFGNMALGDPIAMRFRAPELIAAMAEAIETGDAQITDYAERTPSERAWAVDILPMPMPGETRAVFFLALFRDRTQMRRLERMRTDFVANASHELRTPLAAIIGYVETLADAPDTVDAETAARFHATVLREARRMQSLVSDLMSLSQLEADKHDPPREAIELGQLAARVVGEFTATIGTARIALDRPGRSQLDPYLELLDPDGRTLAEDDDSGGELNSLIQVTLPRSGRYTVVARGLGDSAGRYVLTVTLSDGGTGPQPGPSPTPAPGGPTPGTSPTPRPGGPTPGTTPTPGPRGPAPGGTGPGGPPSR